MIKENSEKGNIDYYYLRPIRIVKLNILHRFLPLYRHNWLPLIVNLPTSTIIVH